MDMKQLLDEELSLISGGYLKEGWEDVTLTMIKMYKAKFGDEGKTEAERYACSRSQRSGFNDG